MTVKVEYESYSQFQTVNHKPCFSHCEASSTCRKFISFRLMDNI